MKLTDANLSSLADALSCRNPYAGRNHTGDIAGDTLT